VFIHNQLTFPLFSPMLSTLKSCFSYPIQTISAVRIKYDARKKNKHFPRPY